MKELKDLTTVLYSININFCRDRRIVPWKIDPRGIASQQIASGKIAPRIIALR